MNKRHYEHTLPNIRGSLSNTYDLTLVFLWASACITTLGSGDSTSWKKVSSKSFAF